ncbi:MAG: DNA-processing protein DprA [Fimbriimonadaceae bacterium]|nr:DNA-processing protein DprA [Fimbriimonadaceae bacterium]QYK54676.1 MAG: DNA-processing protein DprA [Fimbriimonadaceae bacterium]
MALALTPGIGGKSVTRILTRNDLLGRTPDEFLSFGFETLREEYRLNRPAAEAWTADVQRRVHDALALEDRLTPLGVRMVTAADAHYPRRIEQMEADPPGVLFLYGNLRLLEADTFCVLSSRMSAPEALDWVERVAEEGVLDGKVVVAGHDTPEYQRSAVVPLRYGAPRVLVLDRGLVKALGEDLREEPFRTARLWRHQFDDRTDLAVSCQVPDRDFHPNSNRMRDRLVGALSTALAFAEVRPGGNMERIAVAALKAGRPVRVWEKSESSATIARLGGKVSVQ